MDLVKLGKCPICGKGQMVKGTLGFSCNYFRNIEDKCTFNIYHTYFGKEITDEIAIKLIEIGETEVFHNLQKKDGTPFTASLKIMDGVIKPVFKNPKLEVHCPKCERDVEKLLNGYACTGYNETDIDEIRKCSFYIPHLLCGKEITIQMAERLIKEGKTPIIDGFRNREGKPFSSRIVLDKDFNTQFSNFICKCPKCGGDLYASEKAYNCSNYRNAAIKCNFVIWREMCGRIITEAEAITLCEKRETEILSGFRDKGNNRMERKLIINDDFIVKMI